MPALLTGSAPPDCPSGPFFLLRRPFPRLVGPPRGKHGAHLNALDLNDPGCALVQAQAEQIKFNLTHGTPQVIFGGHPVGAQAKINRGLQYADGLINRGLQYAGGLGIPGRQDFRAAERGICEKDVDLNGVVGDFGFEKEDIFDDNNHKHSNGLRGQACLRSVLPVEAFVVYDFHDTGLTIKAEITTVECCDVIVTVTFHYTIVEKIEFAVQSNECHLLSFEKFTDEEVLSTFSVRLPCAEECHPCSKKKRDQNRILFASVQVDPNNDVFAERVPVLVHNTKMIFPDHIPPIDPEVSGGKLQGKNFFRDANHIHGQNAQLWL